MATKNPSKGTNRTPGSEPAQSPGTRGLAALVSWAAVVGGAARAHGLTALRAATGETGRRLARAAALTVALAVLVGALYDRADVPTAAAQPGVVAAGGSGAQGGAAARRADPDGQGGLRGRTRPAAVGERPADVAAAWYAARHGAARSRVKPLQQDRLSAREVRVLVLADLGHGRLRTALVRVRRGPDGWRVR
jgi:hypothetical protein